LGKNRNKIRISIVAIIAAAITVDISFYLLVPVSNPFYNPLYPGLVISAIVVGTTWWIHTILKAF
jgi:hypothetical protein